MSKILKMLDLFAGYYNNLPEEKKVLKNGQAAEFLKSDMVKNMASPIVEKTKSFVKNTKAKTSKRKGPRQSNEVTFNHPRKEVHS